VSTAAIVGTGSGLEGGGKRGCVKEDRIEVFRDVPDIHIGMISGMINESMMIRPLSTRSGNLDNT
jgi:hypothetical protein